MVPISRPLLLMVRPFSGYRALAAAPEGPSIALGAGRLMLTLGCLVSVSATGRFAPVEILFAMVSFAWLPLVHTISIALTMRVFSKTTPWRRALGLYLEGTGAWQLLFLILIGVILFAPHPERPQVGIFPVLVIASGWSIFLSYACLRAGIGLTRGRAALATLFFWVMNHVLILGYFLAVGQLWPIL